MSASAARVLTRARPSPDPGGHRRRLTTKSPVAAQRRPPAMCDPRTHPSSHRVADQLPCMGKPTAGTEFPADTIALTHGPPRDSRSWTRAPASTEERISLYSDKVLTCADCSQDFVFTASEQDFFATRGFTEPRRCSSCRASRKAARGDTGGSSTGFGDRGGGGGYGDSSGGYGGGSSSGGGGYSRGPREMFTATCSSCGKEASVPFRPTSGKPVYCSDCFATRRA